MNSATFETTTAQSNNEELLEAQVTQLWGVNAIVQKHSSPSDKVGAMTFIVAGHEVEIARWVGGEFMITPPSGSAVFVDKLMMTSEAFVLRQGHTADVTMGDFTFQFSVSAREKRIKKNVTAAILEDGGVRTTLGSGMMHAALLAAVAFFMPSMSSADTDGIDRTRILQMKEYLTSSAERDQLQEKQQDNSTDASGNNATGGKTAAGESGPMGGDKHPVTAGRWTAKGDEKPENAQLARDRALKEAAEFGMIGLIASTSSSDPNAPVVPWGNVLAGSDRESHMGNLWSGDPGDAFGWGLGLEGTGEGGGGTGQGVGMNGINGLGHIGGTCAAGEHCEGIGHGHDRLRGGHVPHGPSLTWNPTITTNGRLDPAVIQRIVRLNSGRFMGCYKEGLVHNPSLQGRVSVAFVIGRDGSVQTSQDTAGSDLADHDVRACVVKSFSSLSFPEPAGGIVSVTYPFSFTPE
ncbi:MAG TPA: AgmX/PglI C-terminal domain-containing protein, partial [Polyangiaceae bacterium]|jgi:hypothetical protein|nr:AgmX/PglI C-terminal domain-containing protein [Polyangiaceae bacterium]